MQRQAVRPRRRRTSALPCAIAAPPRGRTPHRRTARPPPGRPLTRAAAGLPSRQRPGENRPNRQGVVAMLSLWNDVPLLDSFDRVLDDVMRSAFGTSGAAMQSQSFQPAIDLRSDHDNIILECDVPGMKHGDLEVTLDHRVLTIKGTRKLESAGDNQRVLLGRPYGSFSYSYTLPEGVDAEHMTADLSNGVLTVTVPKLPQAKPRKISIGGGSQAKQLNQ